MPSARRLRLLALGQLALSPICCAGEHPMTAIRNLTTRRLKRLYIRMSERELEAINAKARECALSASEYVRRCAFGRALSTRIDQEALSELRRQGGLIKHLASTDRQHAYEYRIALNLIHEAIRRLCGEITRKLTRSELREAASCDDQLG